MRNILVWSTALLTLPVLATERVFDFGEYPLEQTPPGFRSTGAGAGRPGNWRVILDEVPPVLPPLTSKAAPVTRRAVLAQLARDAAENRFPMLLFEGETYRDFKLATRFKIVGGGLGQTAGVVFRFQNESNFYVTRASALSRDFRCFKVAQGEWKPPIGPEAAVSKGDWHELSVECEGTRIHCVLDGTNEIKLIDASGPRSGKIGFWTESDSVSYFSDTKITYPESQTIAQRLVDDAVKKYPRLQGLKIYAATAAGAPPVVVASKDPKDLGKPGGKTEQDVISHGTRYLGKAEGSVFVTVPLHDRNGDPIAAVCVILKSFPGQTEENALARAQPVVQRLQAKVQSLEDLLQ
jgi:hypothetical protein